MTIRGMRGFAPQAGLLVAAAAALQLSGCGSNAVTTTTAAHVSHLDAVHQRGELRVGIRYEDPPHSFVDSSGQLAGFDVDIAAAVAKQLGVQLKIVRVDELTRISYLKNGTIDVAITSISKTLKRGQQIDFSQTYFFSKQTFLVRKDTTSLAELADKRVAIDRGSNAGAQWKTWLQKHGYSADPDLVEFSSKQAAVDAVRSGSVAGYAEDYEILASFAHDDSSLAVLGNEGIGVKLDGIGLPRNDSDFAFAINSALQHIAASGQYDTIYDRWFGPNSKTPVPRQGSIEVWPHG